MNIDSNVKLYIFVPYIKTEILAQLVENNDNKKIIMTTWRPNDILMGSSELGLYLFCKKNNITLYINNNIHLKVYSKDLTSAIITSGNISQRGLMPEGNYEIGILIEKLTNSDILYFENIRNNAILITDKIYQEYKYWFDKQIIKKPITEKFEDIVTITEKDDFLISALPMTKNLDDLIAGYEKINDNLRPSDDQEITACIFHDLVNFKINLGLTKEKFIEELKNNFIQHPFIQKIDEFINEKPRYFGSVKEWIQNNCTDVPVPSRRVLTGNVQVLYDWFGKLGNEIYVIDKPNHSQRITKINS